eukprot:TRINITY_DN8830_c0_g1_i2.p1 TRINITY_DN8830_c0_g1~~TRINITY_DN8830_c0_g1_i2.p1  ORF type:complete len:828 (+),score=177.39 TRINITY_DN8830_c0_g1_i2:588-3071(+)
MRQGTPTLATHFEPLKARAFLPCFDHPSIKARFRLTVMKKWIPKGFVILSNTNPEEEDAERVVFKETPEMCSYLLCLVIAKLHWVESSVDNRIRLRVYIPQSVPLDNAKGCLMLVQKAVIFYEKLFGQELRLEKLDLVGLKALPPIAMENVGCLAFRLNYVILNGKTPVSRVQRIVRLVAHEVSHHWFGNSTSINSWCIVWLKEGFARYLEYLFTVYLFPSWDYWTDFAQGISDCAKQMDAIAASTHPLEPASPPTPSSITDSFDFITYNKGASIVRMLAETVGWSVFSSGVRIFLSAHKDNSATVTDFCNALQTACTLTHPPPFPPSSLGVTDTPIDLLTFRVEEWTSLWRTAPSHPVVFVRVVEGGIAMQQFLVPEPTRQVPFEVQPSLFTLPIAIKLHSANAEPTIHTVLLPPTATATEYFMPLPDPHCTVILNPHCASFCRVWYDSQLFPRILRTYSSHPSLTRLGLFLDCFRLLSVSSIQLQQQDRLPSWWKPRGHTGLEHQLYQLLAAFRDARETHNNVVSAAATAALDILHRSQGESCEEGVRRAVVGYFQHLLPKVKQAAWQEEWDMCEGQLGFERFKADSDLSPAVAGMVLSCLGSAWHSETIVFSRDLRDKLMESMSHADTAESDRPDLTVAVHAVKVCVQHGGEKDWWDAWHLYTWTQQPDDLEDDEPLPVTNVEPRDLSWMSVHPPVTLHGRVSQGYQLRATLLECLAASPHIHIAQNVAKLSQKPSLSHDTSDIISLCTGILQNTALIDQVLLASSARVIWFLIRLAPSFGSPLWLDRNEGYWQNMGAPLKTVIRSNVQITRAIIDNLKAVLPQ